MQPCIKCLNSIGNPQKKSHERSREEGKLSTKCKQTKGEIKCHENVIADIGKVVIARQIQIRSKDSKFIKRNQSKGQFCNHQKI